MPANLAQQTETEEDDSAANDNDVENGLGSGAAPPPANDNAQDAMMIGVALVFDFLKFIFSLFFIFLPIIICGGVAAWVYSKTGSGLLSGAACAASGALAGFAEFVSGIGAAVVEAIGAILADAIGFLAWITFYFWFTMRGMNFMSGKNSTKRFFISGTGFLLDMIPLINMAPWTTASVALMIWQKRAENELARKAANENNEGEDMSEEGSVLAARNRLIQRQREQQEMRRAQEEQMLVEEQEESEEEEPAEQPSSNVIDFNARKQARVGMPAVSESEQSGAA